MLKTPKTKLQFILSQNVFCGITGMPLEPSVLTFVLSDNKVLHHISSSGNRMQVTQLILHVTRHVSSIPCSIVYDACHASMWASFSFRVRQSGELPPPPPPPPTHTRMTKIWPHHSPGWTIRFIFVLSIIEFKYLMCKT